VPVLEIAGPSETKSLTLEELKSLPVAEGYAGSRCPAGSRCLGSLYLFAIIALEGEHELITQSLFRLLLKRKAIQSKRRRKKDVPFD
jgi:hypothetical protein